MSDDTPTPADLARELIRLRKAATQGTWKIENSHWTGKPYNVLVENVIDGQVFHPWVLMKFLDGWSPGEADAAIIVYAVNHARTIAEALLAAEAVIAKHALCHDLHGKVGRDEFEEGCRRETVKEFGSCGWADKLAAAEARQARCVAWVRDQWPAANERRCKLLRIEASGMIDAAEAAELEALNLIADFMIGLTVPGPVDEDKLNAVALAAAEARVAELEAALAMCDTMMDSAAMQGVAAILMPASRDMWAKVALEVAAVLAKGSKGTPS